MTIKTLSHSSIQDFLACPRRFEWKKVRRLRKVSKGAALHLGDRFHHGLDLLKNGATIEEAVEQVWDIYQNVPPWVRDIEAWEIEREKCVRLLIGWHALTEPLDVVQSEVPFEAKIRNPETGHATGRFRLTGIVDGIARLADGRLAVLEHKTTSKSLDLHGDYVRRLRVDAQISRYLLAVRDDLNIDVRTVLYDIVRKPTIKPRMITQKAARILKEEGTYFGELITDFPRNPRRESPEMYGARLSAELVAYPERYFLRLEVPRLEQDLEDAAGELWEQQRSIARALRSGRFYRNDNACLSPYRCEFASLCLSGMTPDRLDNGEIPDGYQPSTST